ncbi:transposase [Clostridium sporogenes]|uniref:Transposase IS4-like domain-containing protein n=1 Tax=Clostridium botulinum TaxID=1491 RepID=A0A6M0SWF5_CLOBO|nr:hypothetical protein [Clostridium botulinum]NFI72943.1 transposase [Clostridium sporogenes]NFL71405.1 transposase [Clostridium sporogenes]NFM22984.1 transposase [Clostridium sporogenes]NFP60356.1 transposase [Clostridium sporogenes]
MFKLLTVEIAWLYKKRWEIELFFKWIKQNLKIKKIIGHSLNVVMMQIISAIMTFLMLKLIEKESISFIILNLFANANRIKCKFKLDKCYENAFLSCYALIF